MIIGFTGGEMKIVILKKIIHFGRAKRNADTNYSYAIFNIQLERDGKTKHLAQVGSLGSAAECVRGWQFFTGLPIELKTLEVFA